MQQWAMVAWIQGYGNSSLTYLLLASLGLVILASLALVVTSILALLSDSSRYRRSGAKAEALTLTPTGISPPEVVSPVEDGRWMKLVEECVDVVDELDEHMSNFDAPRREVAGHVIVRLEEILGRSGVEIISHDASFDRARHKPDPTNAATDNGAAIHQTLSPGFALGSRVLRRARVRVE
jgi:hypothetical protein